MGTGTLESFDPQGAVLLYQSSGSWDPFILSPAATVANFDSSRGWVFSIGHRFAQGISASVGPMFDFRIKIFRELHTARSISLAFSY